MAFFRRVNPCFWSKNAIFFHYLFSLKVRLELGVNNVRDRKTTFFDYKNKIFHSLKNCLFAKGLTHVFGKINTMIKKWNFFLYLFSVKKGLEIRLNDVLDRKQTFFD